MTTQNYRDYYSPIYYDELVNISSKAKGFQLWRFSKDLSLSGLNTKGVLSFLEEHGFYKRQTHNGTTNYIKITGKLAKYVTKDVIGIYLQEYIENIDIPVTIFRSKNDNENRKIEVEEFINVFLNNSHNIINDRILLYLKTDSSTFLKDNKETAYMFFNNVVLTITKDKIINNGYDEFENVLISETQIINADFQFEEDWKISPFVRFVKNITDDNTERKNSIRSAFGYLLHNYNDISNSQAVILYDEEFTDLNTPMGGSGKGIIGQALKVVSNGYMRIDGKGIRLDSQFIFQRVEEETRIVFIDDVYKKFDIERFNSVLSDGIEIEKKFKNPIQVSKENMPKFVIASNVIMAYEGTTLGRRQYVIELSNHYSIMLRQGVAQPIIREHGARFFSDEWNAKNWNGFYTFFAKCLQYYLANGLVEPPKLNMKKNKVIQKMGFPLYNAFQDMAFKSEKEYSTTEIYLKLIDDGIIDEQTSKRMITESLKQYLLSEEMNYKISSKQKITIFRI